MKSIVNELNKYNKELEAIGKELQTLPAGYLVKRGSFYSHAINTKETGITKNPKRIHTLCRKRYLLARQAQIEKNVAILSQAVSKLTGAAQKELFKTFPNAYQGLPDSAFFHTSMENWLAEPYQKNSYYPEHLIYTSKKGTQLRSKSELLIATQLEANNIPYRYDAELILGNQTKYPDFTIKNPFTGTTIIWEHFGALNKSEYEQSMNEKMRLYMKHGYIPFETLIYTFEFDIETDRLQALIEDIILSA